MSALGSASCGLEQAMKSERLGIELRSADLRAGEMVYLERRGEEYGWTCGQVQPGAVLPDSWMYYTGEWPVGDDGRWEAFFADLLAELDSMTTTGDDRCRWSPDDPWPHGGLHG
ncbi:MAG: hypothetical protein H0V92_07485 [Pseudonocardiales bacterium]|nr:hypothetical protein [Pseudonocardiales bacterium]